MRLINADKYLEKVCTYKETGCGSCKLQTMCPKDAPTVKAIPIEWIDGYIKRRANDVNIYAEILFISDMVKEWEKENETNAEC